MLRLKENKFKHNNTKAQSLIEYAIVIGIISIVLMAMGPMIQRGIQSMVRMTADQIGNQQCSEQPFDDTGHTEFSRTDSNVGLYDRTQELFGERTYGYGGFVQTKTITIANLGFSESQGR